MRQGAQQPQEPREAREGDEPVRVVLGGPDSARHVDTFLDGRLEIHSSRGTGRADALLVSALDQKIQGKVLVVRSRQGLVALAMARLFPDAEVHTFDLDAYEHHRLVSTARLNRITDLHPHLKPDLPRLDYDWICLPAPQTGDGRLTGELLRQAFASLKSRGKLLASTDNPKDRWLHERIQDVFGAVTIYRRSKHGTIYVARRAPERRLRDRDLRRSFTGRLFGHTIELESRPGVFSHGRVDDGTLSLADVARIEADSRVLDLGCGAGALGIAAALSAPRGLVVLVDSYTRSVASARASQKRNQVSANSLVLLAHDLSALRDDQFDVVLANPPYYGDYSIFEHFTRESQRVLKPGGCCYLVTKTPERSGEIMRSCFSDVEMTPRRSYSVLRGVVSR